MSKQTVTTITTAGATIVVSNIFAGASGNLLLQLDGTLEAPSAASPAALNIVTSASAGTLTIYRGSYCNLN